MAETTAQLQQKLKALTNGKVDIMLNADEFKSTTQILREMADVWQEMTDVQRAASLELLGGKRQANILSSVITNFQTVEDVIQTSMESSGSAIVENEKYLDSIQGRLDLFSNSLQKFWSNLIDSETVKTAVDAGTSIINLLDTTHGKVIALVAAVKLMAKFKGFSLKGIGVSLVDSIKQLSIAQQTLATLTSNPATKFGQGYDITNINLYAAAVSNLTAKQQANMLASAGLSKAQIQLALQYNGLSKDAAREATAHIFAKQAKDQEKLSDQQLLTNKILLSAASLKLAGDTDSLAAAEFLEANAAKYATAEELKAAIVKDAALTPAAKAAALATVGQASANIKLGASFKALFASNPVGMILTIATTILSVAIPAFNYFSKSAERLKEEVKELTDTYEEAKQSFNDNLKTLTTSSDVNTYATLEEEFKQLTKGVDAYGNNISLTADQYERYRKICETICDINPSLKTGYDSVTEAIGNNASVLSNLIELQKIQAKQAAQEYVTDENIEKIFKDKANDLQKAREKVYAYLEYNGADGIYGIGNLLFKEFDWNNVGTKDYGDASSNADDLAKKILETMGISDIDNKLKEYYNKNGYFQWSQFTKAYADQIAENVKVFKNDALSNWAVNWKSAKRDLENAQNGMINTFLQIPFSLDEYDKLQNSSKSFITDWIKNSGLFTIDENTTQEEILTLKAKIRDFVEQIANNNYSVTLDNGSVITASEILDSIYNFDTANVDWEKYKAEIQNLINLLWQSIGAENNTLGFDDKGSLALSLGFDIQITNDQEKKMKARYKEITGKTDDEVEAYFNSLPATTVQRLLKIDWNLVDENNLDDTINPNSATQIISSQAYSALADSAAKYNDIIATLNELAYDNIEITQEQYDALKELIGSEEEFSDCIDISNGYIVKNTALTKKLVDQKKKEQAADVKLAKSQARLEYYKLVKQLSNTLNSTKKLDAATRDSISTTLSQIDVVEQAIYKYQLLEDSLLGATNAFDEFAKAQEIDALNTYGDSYVEMAQTMYDALYKTGQVGTERFQAALKALVPDDIYQGLAEEADRMQAIFEYFNNSIVPTLTLEDDSLTLDYSSIENFVNKALEAKVLLGDVENFDLAEGMNLEKAAELMHMTTTQAYAFFAELDKYNTGSEQSFLSQLDDSLEGKIVNATMQLEELNRQKLALLEGDGYTQNATAIKEIDDQIIKVQSDLNNAGKAAYDMWQAWTKNEAALAGLNEIKGKVEQLDKETAAKFGIELKENEFIAVEDAINLLLAEKLKLEEPTVLTAQLAIDDIDNQISELDALLADRKTLEIEAKESGKTVEDLKTEIQQKIQALKEDKAGIAIEFGIELSEDDKKTLQEELDSIENFTIGDKEFTVIAKGTSEVMKSLQAVNDYAKDVTKTVTTVYQTVGSGNNETVRTSGSGGRYTRANGTAHAQGNWGVPKTETALVGELGPEIIVDPKSAEWHTVGDNGAEFTTVPRGSIVFNHKQTEQLLKNGYITGRGKLQGGSALASGTAYAGLWGPTNGSSASSGKGSGSSSADDAKDQFEEIFDWIEVRLEEINKQLDFKNARLDNSVGFAKQNAVINEMLDLNEKLYDNLIAGANKYYEYAGTLLAKIPAQYRQAAQDGSIAIETFIGEVDEETYNAIQDFREWVQKGDDAVQQAEEVITEVSSLAKQAIDNIATDFENKNSITGNIIDQLDAYNALTEAKFGAESEEIYQAIIEETNKNIKTLEAQRNQMQAELNKQVKEGNIQKYSQDWYDAINAIAEVDTEIINLTKDTYDYRDSINELHWDHFDNILSRLEAISNEADNLIDILGSKELVDESGNWTREGITSLGMYAQKMDAAEVQAKKYKDEIYYLNKNWKKLGYTEQEYVEKLEELKKGQYDSIKAYEDTKKAIVDLNKERVDAIKKGIEKEIESYEKLVNKKKEALDADKDQHDFQKSIAEKQKNISDIQRKIDALSTDNSDSARARRAKLESELLEAQADLQEAYYDRSITEQQNALDKELESVKQGKEEEMEAWDEYLENTNKVVADSLETVQSNTDAVYRTLTSMGKEYGLSITESLTSPWKDGENAIQSFSDKFGLSMSSTVEELQKLSDEYKKVMEQIANSGNEAVQQANNNASRYQEANNPEKPKFNPPETVVKPVAPSSGASSGGSSGFTPVSSHAGEISGMSGYLRQGSSGSSVKILQQALNDLGFNAGTVDGIFGYNTKQAVARFQSSSSYGGAISADGVVGPDTKRKFRAAGYAKGTAGVKKNQLALIDELGEELQLVPDGNGRLAYLKKGTAIIPHDISENLMQLGQLNPQDILDRNRPTINAPHITNNETVINIEYGDVLHIENFNGDKPEDLSKMIDKAFNKHMKDLNQQIRKFTR